jgi:nitronate monooxygenase
MTLPTVLQNLSLPVIASPMFIASGPALVAAQCKAGIVGSFPALNARPAELLDTWLTELQQELADFKAANPNAKVGPIAVNQIVHASNARLEHDVEVCVKHQVPIIISSLRAPPKEMLDAVHSYGGIVLHDVVSIRHAQKALEAGVDGLILVAAGAGGHAGALSPFALVGEVRKFFDGPLALSGSIATGDAILAAQAMGADFAYIGSRWLATKESNVGDDCSDKAKAWKDIWGAGQGVGLMDDVPSVSELVERLRQEYAEARARICALS